VELLLRFLIGGSAVSLFAIAGGVLRPKSFAGLFGAAPSVALATLALTVWERSAAFAAIETRVFARRAAGRDAAGAALGGVGLACFGAR
jgi:hypothetical protein